MPDWHYYSKIYSPPPSLQVKSVRALNSAPAIVIVLKKHLARPATPLAKLPPHRHWLHQYGLNDQFSDFLALRLRAKRQRGVEFRDDYLNFRSVALDFFRHCAVAPDRIARLNLKMRPADRCRCSSRTLDVLILRFQVAVACLLVVQSRNSDATSLAILSSRSAHFDVCSNSSSFRANNPRARLQVKNQMINSVQIEYQRHCCCGDCHICILRLSWSE